MHVVCTMQLVCATIWIYILSDYIHQILYTTLLILQCYYTLASCMASHSVYVAYGRFVMRSICDAVIEYRSLPLSFPIVLHCRWQVSL